MATRRPLVNVAGTTQELPAGDVLAEQASSLDLPDNVAASTFPRFGANTVLAPTGGQLRLTLMRLVAGQSIGSLRCVAGNTAGSGLTHSLAGLYTASQTAPALLATSNDDTTAAWAATTTRAWALTTPYVVPATGWYYAALLVVGTTLPTLFAQNPGQGNGLNSVPPATTMTAQSGLTTTLPATATGLAVVAPRFYMEAL